jgi:hypothetical protein
MTDQERIELLEKQLQELTNLTIKFAEHADSVVEQLNSTIRNEREWVRYMFAQKR